MKGNIFQRVRHNKPKRNAFNLSHERKFTTQFGKLTPILCQEVIPGDSFRVNTESLVRFAPLIAPMMQRVDVYTHYFYVPNRLVWNEWEQFITGGEKGEYTGINMPIFPKFIVEQKNTTNPESQIVENCLKIGSLADHFGFPSLRHTYLTGQLGITYNHAMFPKISQLPFRAYQLIWNEYYRDQNLQDPIEIELGSGYLALNDLNNKTKVESMMQLRNRNWEKDYYTSALPFAQKGVEVKLPISGKVSLADNNNTGYWDVPENLQSSANQINDGATNKSIYGSGFNSVPGPNKPYRSLSGHQTINNTDVRVRYDPAGSLEVTDGNTTINDFRRALSLQRWFERNARAGSRYTEFILSHFGVHTKDSRLQRPEYLGGGKAPVSISEVIQNSQTPSDPLTGEPQHGTPQGNMTGHGLGVGRTNKFTRSFSEHGYIIGLMSVMPKASYMTGVPRHLLRDDPFDFFFPEFAHLGEQPVFNGEVSWRQFGTSLDSSDKNLDTFGYQSRYAEYKFTPSSVHGDMRDTLDFWHMARKFSDIGGSSAGNNTVPLNSEFITCKDNDDTLRPFAVTEQDKDRLWIQVYNDVQAIRPIPIFSEPF